MRKLKESLAGLGRKQSAGGCPTPSSLHSIGKPTSGFCKGFSKATDRCPLLNKRIEITAVHRTGREFSVELAISSAKIADPWTFSAFVRDISDRRQAEEAREEANRAKSEFLILQAADKLQQF
jgi:hypothetical protein